jgi:cytidyltransferase-like protein
MVFGTFDGLHKGHVNFLKQAKNLSEKSVLIVSIARDRNVFKIKGAYPRKKERERMMLIKKSGLADKVILSGIKNHLPHIIKEHPDVIALGYDQTAYVTNLNVKIVRLKPYQEKIYKNSLLKKKN